MVASRDLELLSILFRKPFASYADLGRQVGMTGQGARKRVMRLREEGVLRGFVATPVPAVFGRVGRFVTFEEPSVSLEDALAGDDVVLAATTLDELLTVVGFLTPEDAREHGDRRLRDLDAGSPAYAGRYRDRVDPPELGPLEWRVLRVILDEPRIALTDLAEATGLTLRTVRDRRESLVETGAVEVTPLLGPSEAGRLFFHLAVVGSDVVPQAVARKLDGTVLAEEVDGLSVGSGRATMLFCEVDSLAARRELVDRAAEIDGVEEVRPYLLDDYRVHTQRLDAWIEEALQAWDRARRGGA